MQMFLEYIFVSWASKLIKGPMVLPCFSFYRGTHHWVPRTKRLFGGQIVGQALVAAANSVSEHLYAHSLHCYFVRAGPLRSKLRYLITHEKFGFPFISQ